MISGRRRSVIFFTVLGICLVALAVALNISWIVLNWRRGVLVVLGIVLFVPIIAGMVLNTIFLVREIRRNEQHDSFINAVTHELKTPVASIRCICRRSRAVSWTKRSVASSIASCSRTIVWRRSSRCSGEARRARRISRTRLDLGELTKVRGPRAGAFRLADAPSSSSVWRRAAVTAILTS
jgi:signal transduction histidine kinase